MPESAKDHAIADIERALSKNRLTHRIAASMPLDEIVRGNQLVESATMRGAVLLQI
jgi:hypothetical protein